MRERVLEAARHYQDTRDASYVYDYASPMLGLREGRRIECDYVVTIDDVRSETRFDDAVAYGTFSVDANRTREVIPPYQIPYRSLTAKGVDNCLVAGRALSSDRLTLSSARVMPTCCMMGQAAGHAAAIAAGDGIPMRDVDAAAVRGAMYDCAREVDLMRERLEPKGS
jgi:hypothetical protein